MDQRNEVYDKILDGNTLPYLGKDNASKAAAWYMYAPEGADNDRWVSIAFKNKLYVENHVAISLVVNALQEVKGLRNLNQDEDKVKDLIKKMQTSSLPRIL